MSEHRVLFVAANQLYLMAWMPIIREMQRQNIPFDIFVPVERKESDSYREEYQRIADSIESAGLSVLRSLPENKKYDVLYSAYPVDFNHEFEKLKNVKYFIRLNYGVGGANKPALYYSTSIFGYYDFILCLSETDASIFSGQARTFSIGNVKLVDYKRERTASDKKKTVLYLPTWATRGTGTSSANDDIVKKLTELQTKYNIVTKMHNHTSFHDTENERRELFSKFTNVYDPATPTANILNEADVVLSDLSSAAFDAIAGDVPLALFGLGEPVDFGGRLCLHQQLVKDDIIPGTNDINELESVIEKALSPEYFEKQQKLKKEMFPFEGRECLEAFMRFQDDLFNDRIDSWYIAARRALRNHLSIETKERLIKNEEWLKEREWIDGLVKTIEDKDNIIENTNKTMETAINEIRLAYECSTSWKLTKPFRALSNLFKKK